jgi:4-hydroxybenzoate polyprenyltransferase
MNKLIYLNPEYWFYCVFRLLNQIRHDGDKDFKNNDFLRHRAIIIYSVFNSSILMILDIILEVFKLNVLFYLFLIIPFYKYIRKRFFNILENYKNVSQKEWSFFGYLYFLIFIILIIIRINF